ncbi:CpaF family protein [Sneathiella chinensis]|uniref:Fimbriae assembly protein n=1 Tax=Sneathiella chinensis TaxID=349750 RepID=A0ABQ5U3L3_9PROT|nr:CpaF family protein [Sneathiella chinensis]GLQ06667.1 fimbriae assembly protein [Sneathiella chinensis]
MFGKKNDPFPTGLEDPAAPFQGPEGAAADPPADPVVIEPPIRARVEALFYQQVNPARVTGLSRSELAIQVTQAVSQIVENEKIPLNWKEQSSLTRELLDDLLGTGPIQPLLRDPEVSDILVNGPNSVFVEKKGTLVETAIRFRDDAHVLSVARRMAGSVGRRVDESSPMVDARLPDGSRVNIIAPPLSIHGTIISIRKFSERGLSLEDLVSRNSASDEMVRFLGAAVASRMNILISGGTGAGKTTVLNALSGCIGKTERIVTIEDAAEINLQQTHVISLETRQRSAEGVGEVTQRDLLRNALRMRPDRIVIGEVRGDEVVDMLQAMNTGHDGSMSTVHANSAREALVRLEHLMLSSSGNFQVETIQRQIASALDLVVHVKRDPAGHRSIRAITEVIGIESGTIVTQDLFRASASPPGAGGGGFEQVRVRPHCLTKAAQYGLDQDIREILS